MHRFVANISMLFTELPFLERFQAAARAGFEGVECHWPYEHALDDLRAAIRDSGMALYGINTVPGRPGEFGLAALPGREADFNAAMDQALDYARALAVPHIHVMAGKPEGCTEAEVEATYIANLKAACTTAGPVRLLIEPINPYDVPGFALNSTDQAVRIIEAVGSDTLKILFDCYHLQILEGDITRRFARLLPHVGHVQFAAVPDRGEPDQGELDLAFVLNAMRAAGYDGAFAAEYRPRTTTQAGLGWMTKLG